MNSGFTRKAVEQLSATLNEPAWMREFRLEAFELYQSLPMPTTSDEPWRRTDIRPLQLDAIGPSLNGRGGETPAGLPMTSLDEPAGTLLQVDGMTVRRELAERWSEAGVIFGDMETAVQEHGELLREHFMTRAVASVFPMILAWVNIAPLGFPVVPLVYKINVTSSGFTES